MGSSLPRNLPGSMRAALNGALVYSVASYPRRYGPGARPTFGQSLMTARVGSTVAMTPRALWQPAAR